MAEKKKERKKKESNATINHGSLSKKDLQSFRERAQEHMKSINENGMKMSYIRLVNTLKYIELNTKED